MHECKKYGYCIEGQCTLQQREYLGDNIYEAVSNDCTTVVRDAPCMINNK